MMRKLLISLSALVLVAFPVRAQTPVLWWLQARFSLDRWTIFGSLCQGWLQRWPRNQGH